MTFRIDKQYYAMLSKWPAFHNIWTPDASWITDEDTNGDDIEGIPVGVLKALYPEPMTFGPEWRTFFQVIREFDALVDAADAAGKRSDGALLINDAVRKYLNWITMNKGIETKPFRELANGTIDMLANLGMRYGKFKASASLNTFAFDDAIFDSVYARIAQKTFKPANAQENDTLKRATANHNKFRRIPCVAQVLDNLPEVKF